MAIMQKTSCWILGIPVPKLLPIQSWDNALWPFTWCSSQPYAFSLALSPCILSGAKQTKKKVFFLLAHGKVVSLSVYWFRLPPTPTHREKQVTLLNNGDSLPKRNSNAIKRITFLPHYISIILKQFLIIFKYRKTKINFKFYHYQRILTYWHNYNRSNFSRYEPLHCTEIL